ncbi:MAG: 3-phosphoshikimate 1-carboxyvinyltransferase [Firmicutes bacterium]|nr:3-phosphoshikimate 1-carboxyvinyltransferase [Bacillota bacterium]
MRLYARQSKIFGKVRIPGSKSHTIRALFLASLAEGTSEIVDPLISNDALSAVEVCKAFGAKVETLGNRYLVQGFGGIPQVPEDVINVGNSGTTLRIAAMTAALGTGATVFTGDYQIRRRPLGPLINAINNLGATAFSIRDNGMAPVMVRGRAKGGVTDLDAVSSQYLTSLLLNAPLLERDTEIHLIRLNEVPYVEMTLWWLNRLGIKYQNQDFKKFFVKGGQKYHSFQVTIPGDFSSATFFMVLAAISGGEIQLENLDMSDPQGDKRILSILETMGAKVTYQNNLITIRGGELIGGEFDLNATPDALPAMAVAGCFARGETRLVNTPQARIKETDRIRVMYEELQKLGADVEELPDGLIIRESKLKGAHVSGHDDHRIVMALAVAGLNIPGETVIDTAEAMSVTFPDFVTLINYCHGELELKEV